VGHPSFVREREACQNKRCWFGSIPLGGWSAYCVEESAIATATIAALTVHLHNIGQPGPAGAMPFGKLVTSWGQ
jgi:hypothetical protein